ncbi:hypothetical protein ACFFSW_29220 [Saccharothrix longispora]|uniref:Uncharacterized protein n=1 Tax=Saccharothrix longispora TaxID=33920 RepID=A0ABU1PTF4_9PSEU|nr:hypothetical protein [Saccharothrix longispora]MDR6593394.1 hypothetical protein [Saccharothrix longispora]
MRSSPVLAATAVPLAVPPRIAAAVHRPQSTHDDGKAPESTSADVVAPARNPGGTPAHGVPARPGTRSATPAGEPAS